MIKNNFIFIAITFAIPLFNSCNSDQKKSANNSLQEIFSNDNRKPAGELCNGVLQLNLEVRSGLWYPETHDGAPLQVYAFAEAGKQLQLPGPLVRVPEGTEIKLTIHNTIKGSPIIVHGFKERPSSSDDSVVIAGDETAHLNFKAGNTGTYFYWASVKKSKSNGGLPYFDDSQLYGAFIIDSSGKQNEHDDRIMMIGIWNDTLNGKYNGEELVINGLTWPYTERLTYHQNEEVHWRVINASNQSHPMHLHGFYYSVNSIGSCDSDVVYQPEDRRLVNTEFLHSHHTMTMTWVPTRPGNWLFHCHMLVHVMPESFLRKIPVMTDEEMRNDPAMHVRDCMGGLIMGISVLPAKGDEEKADAPFTAVRNLKLIAAEQPNMFDTTSGEGFILIDGRDTSNHNHISVPGPPIILTRDEPVTITVINHLKGPTSIHWHGIEIESYYDGVAGWGTNGKKLAPIIMPGDSFVVRMTPPRAGTFMYHTHMHNEQLIQGMAGPIIVLEPGKKYDQETDKIFFATECIPIDTLPIFVNGSSKIKPMNLKTGTIYRLRFINVAAFTNDITYSIFHLIGNQSSPANWHAIAKDGADLPPNQAVVKPALNQQVAIGETMDFEFTPDIAGKYLLRITGGGHEQEIPVDVK